MQRKVAPPTVDERIAAIAMRQYGVITLVQLQAAGLSLGAIQHRVRLGRLHRLHRGVFAVGHTLMRREGHWLAAVFALGEGAAISHVTAGANLALRPSDAASIHVTVPSHGGRLQRPGIVVHRSTTLRPEDVIDADGIPTTSIARTLLDLAGMLAPGPLERAVARSLALRSFDLTAIRAVIDANRTRRGAATLARIVADIHDEPRLERSTLEARLRDLCDAHQIERPEVNAIVDVYEVDFLWRAQRLIVETDGHEDHGTRIAFERDRARDAHLTVLGYRVVRFTYRQMHREPNAVASTLATLIDAGRVPPR